MGTDIHGRLQIRYRDEPWRDAGPIEDDRNYRVFAILADVRNGYGFANVRTHEPLLPISQPRGFPEDLEVIEDGYIETKSPYEDEPKPEWLGDHSHSWLTLKEILDWPGWSGNIQMTGLLHPDEAARLKREGGLPEEWCGGTNNPDYVRHVWEAPVVTYAACFKKWLDYVACKYDWLIQKDPGSVRIVFGFDS